MSYWMRRGLHRVFKKRRLIIRGHALIRSTTRFIPSVFYCVNCGHHVQANHYEKEFEKARVRRGAEPHFVATFGRLFPNKRAKEAIRAVPSIRKFVKAVKLPAEFDLRNVNGVNYVSPVGDQGQEGSCTGWGLRTMKGSQERESGTFRRDFSARMGYNGAKFLGGYLNQEGAMMIDVMNAAVQFGVCEDIYWPYQANKETDVWPPPNPDALADGKNHRIEWFADCMKDEDGSPAIDPVYNVKLAICFAFVMGGKVVMGATDAGTPWTKSWMDAWYSGKMPLPPDNDPVEGGHSYGIIAWSDSRQVFVCENSWGETNLMGGFFEIPYGSLRCKAWASAGGPEIYKAKDAETVVCPEGQHYDVDRQSCVEDGSSPQPTCDEQLQNDAADCQKYQNDPFNMFVCIVTAYVGWAVCTFAKKFKIDHTMSAVGLFGKRKKRLTITITEV